MTVCSYDKAVIVFKDGSNAEWKIEKKKSPQAEWSVPLRFADFLFLVYVKPLYDRYTFVRKSFENSAVTFLPPAEIYLAQ